MSKQVKLTPEQAQKFYKEYVTQKNKRMDVGGPAEFVSWKNQIEMYLSEAATGANWSNTEIRNANRRLTRSATAPGEHIMSDKQARLFARYLDEKDGAGNYIHAEDRARFAQEYSIAESVASNFVKSHPGVVFAYLTEYGTETWQQYFNS